MSLRLTEKMVKQGTLRLQAFRLEVWEEKQDDIGFLSLVALLPDSRIKTILDNLARIKTVDDLVPYIEDLHHLSDHRNHLLDVLTELQNMFAKLPQPRRKKFIPDATK